jgi:hypothetical protein
MNLPDRIFAVGGAGKAIAFTLLETEWVLREVLEPRPEPYSLSVTIIDTAEDEQNSDRQRVQEVRDNIQDIQAELREDSSASDGRLGSIELDYKLIVEDIQLDSQYDLMGPDVIERIANGNGMDEENWWLNNDHINENLDFAKGVVRKRGLGKAIYYKSYAEDDEISTYIDLPEKGRVAVLAGLGGGTGSGILIDLARDLTEQHRTAEITLFGVLPNHTEGVKENTNAFAMLSELEYLSLQNKEFFKDIVLVPIDPTGFDGKRGNRIQTGQVLEELDEAFLYLLAAYYNTQQLEDPFANKPSYAPFTIGVPQTLRYNVEAISDARGNLRELLQTKEEVLDVEENIYNDIERFLTEQFGDGEEAELRDLDRADLSERLDKVESLLEFDLFEELDYQSLSMFQDIINDAIGEADDVDDQLDIIAGSIRAINTANPEQGFVDEIDEHLAGILERDLRLIARRKELLERKKSISDNRVQETIEYLLGSGGDMTNPGVQLQRLETQRDDLEEEQGRLESRLEEKRGELEDLRDQQADQIERQVRNYEREIETEIQQLQNLSIDTLRTEVDDLMAQLETFLSNVVNASSLDDVEGVSHQPVQEALNQVEAEMEAAGASFEEFKRDINASLTELKQAREALIELNQEESTFESLTPWQSETEEKREEAHKDYRMQKNKLEDRGVFSAGPPGQKFSAQLEFSEQEILREVEQKHENLVEDIVAELRGRIESEAPELIRELETTLNHDPRREEILEIPRQVFRQEVSGTADIEARIDELEDQLADVEDRLGLINPTIELFQDLNNRRDAHQQRQESFDSQWAEYQESSDRSLAGSREDYVYVKNIQPSDVFRATGNNNIVDSGLFSSREETQRLRTNIEQLANNARNQQYTGLLRRKFAQGSGRYDDLKVRVAFMSQAMDQIDPGILDVEDQFTSAFALGGKKVDSPYTTWKRNFGGPWDIGMSVFIDGVFLDNLRKVVRADGFRDGYERRRQEGEDFIIHHAYGLEDGNYICREDLLNLESSEGVEFFIRDEKEINSDLLEDYVSVNQVQTGDKTTEAEGED